MPESILIVDDEEGILRSLERLLRRNKYKVTAKSNAQDGLVAASENDYQVVISDYRMPNMNGTEFLARLLEQSPLVVRLMLSGEADRDAVLASINEAKIFRFMVKPWDDRALLDCIADAVAEHKRLREVAAALDMHRLEMDRNYRQKRALELLEEESPGLTSVNWSDDNTIIIEDD